MGPMSKIGFILDPYPWWNATVAHSAGSDSSCGAIPQDCRMSLTCQHEVARAVGISPLCWLKKILRWWDPLYFCWANDVTSWLHRQTCLFHYGCWVFMLPRPVIHGCATLTPRLREGKGHVKNQSSTQLAVFKFFQLWVKNGKNHLWIQHSHQFHLPKEPGCQTL